MPSARAPRSGRVLVITPTYDEADNLPTTIEALLASGADCDVLVVDDASPDGTGELADRIAASEPRVHVLHRAAKDGLGRAYLAGFAWALERGYDIVVEFDADGSHPADALPAMLEALSADAATGLVIGSRWVPGGRLVDWPASRRLLSRAANAYARVMLRLPVKDVTAGYRAYRAAVLDEIAHQVVDSRGYCFQIDLTIRTHEAGWRIREVPITFRERRAGASKMSRDVVAEAMWRVTAWGVQRLVRPPRTRALGQGIAPGLVDSHNPVPREGDG
ncbi:polyprenol monophosphomannose synthase [Protaetiibacter sp. SSC-01]|uniref:polyprenol monophosphomannose synthase n=1 Tax=Protaetiibacter sp. SSC-01 TaxID=2759943 RepID=UPI001656A65E|nr:polyprenol monophosphomannose synthase [Protaetiibacter sp. SSC-01]QNO37058.1 polyprenol monophosphomannose synthase [Protaetiibacter sp. SSC-01]